MAADIHAINKLLQERLSTLGRSEVSAVDAAQWLDQAGILRDSPDRPGRALRTLLRQGCISGQNQLANGRWFIHPVK